MNVVKDREQVVPKPATKHKSSTANAPASESAHMPTHRPKVLTVECPTLIMIETGSLLISHPDSSIQVDHSQMAVLSLKGQYTINYSDDCKVTIKPINDEDFSFSGNFVINVADCLKASRLLKMEIPLFSLSKNLITIGSTDASPVSDVKDYDRDLSAKALLFSSQDAAIYIYTHTFKDEGKAVIHDAIVIGAGPYGTSATIALKNKHKKVYWVGEALSFWLRKIQPMVLRSAKPATNLYTGEPGFTLLDFYKKRGMDPTGKIAFSDFIAYYFDLITHYNVYPRYEKVINVKHKRDYWEVTLKTASGNKTVQALNVINATGIGIHPRIPCEFAKLPTKQISHVTDFSVQAFPRNKKIAVIGGAQSAIEYALQADELNNDVTIYARDEIFFRNLHQPQQMLYRKMASNNEKFMHLLPSFLRTKVLAYLLEGTCEPEAKEQIEKSHITIHENMSVEAVNIRPDNQVELVTRESSDHYDLVILATGYDYNVMDISYLSEIMSDSNRKIVGKYPALTKYAMLKNSPKGMYFTGFSSIYTLGFKSQFINGTNLVIKRIVDNIENNS